MTDRVAPMAAGVVGVGIMGSGMAQSLARAGQLVAVHDVRPDVLDELPELAACWKSSPADVAAVADVVFIVVVDLPQVEAVLFGPEGVAAAARPGLVACVCSTISAAEVEQLAARAATVGITLVDVGVAGGPDAAATGELVTTTGADEATFEHIRPALEALSRSALHAGPLGAGMKLKLVKNTMSYLTMCAVHEALLLGEELGFPPSLVRQVAADSSLVDHFFWFPMSRPSAHPSPPGTDPGALAASRHFAALARKDLAAAAATADEVGMDHPAIDLAARSADRYFLLPEPTTDASRPAS